MEQGREEEFDEVRAIAELTVKVQHLELKLAERRVDAAYLRGVLREAHRRSTSKPPRSFAPQPSSSRRATMPTDDRVAEALRLVQADEYGGLHEDLEIIAEAAARGDLVTRDEHEQRIRCLESALETARTHITEMPCGYSCDVMDEINAALGDGGEGSDDE